MLAATLTAPRQVELCELREPEPPPNFVRVRLEGSGVCGSNLPVWEGRPWFKYPFEPGAPGHEGWGRIEAVGDDVVGLKPGQRVAALSYHAFAQCDLASADAVAPLPSVLDGEPFPGEALGCAMNVFRRADIRAGQTVAIIGIGFLGALLTALAANAGANVLALSRRPFALDLAVKMGAAETIVLDEHQSVMDRVHALTNHAGCPRVIEAVGAQWPLDLASELTAERGRLIIAGYHQDGPRQVNMQLWNWRGLDVINAHERDPKVYVDGMKAAIDAVAAGDFDPSPLYTHRFPLGQTGAALETMRQRPPQFLKALVTYD